MSFPLKSCSLRLSSWSCQATKICWVWFNFDDVNLLSFFAQNNCKYFVLFMICVISYQTQFHLACEFVWKSSLQTLHLLFILWFQWAWSFGFVRLQFSNLYMVYDDDVAYEPIEDDNKSVSEDQICWKIDKNRYQLSKIDVYNNNYRLHWLKTGFYYNWAPQNSF